MANDFRYRAFISYSHQDKSWGRWLHRKLETFRVPRKVVGATGRDGPIPRKLYPIFRDQEELPASADLSQQILIALEQSACLTVICSPHSAKSRWVNEEILTYKRMGREKRILAIIVGGEPNASDKSGVDPSLECFPPALRFRMGADGRLTSERIEPLAADTRPQGEGRDNAKLKVIAGILGVSYDGLKQREEVRRLVRVLAAASVLATALGAAGLYAWQQYDQGFLIAESEPVHSSISVDGVELGARIRNLPLRTGSHQLVAWAPDHFELSRSIIVPRQQAVRTQFWLENALEWKPYASPSIQSGQILIPRADDTILAHNELTRIIFLSTNTGQIIDSIPTPAGNRRHFRQLDLGGNIGKVIVSGYEANYTGPELMVIGAGIPAKIMWRWQGPATNFAEPTGLAIEALPMPQGASSVAVAGRDGSVYFLDGASGQKIDEVEISPTPLAAPPTLVLDNAAEATQLVAFYREASTDNAAAQSRLRAIALDSSTHQVVWRRDLGTHWFGVTPGLLIKDTPHVVVWNDMQWRSIKLTTGATGSEGALPGRTNGGPVFADLESRGTLDFVFQFEEKMLAVGAADGKKLWQSPPELRLFGPMRGADNILLRTPSGGLLVALEDAFAALDPANGQIIWKLAGQPIGALVDDWNGDGKAEIFVTMEGIGLLCLDENGNVLWKTRMAKSNAKPWALVKSRLGGAIRDVLVHLHAGMIGRIHGPRLLWKSKAPAALQATPVVTTAEDDKPVIVEIIPWGGGGARLRALDGREGGVRWTEDKYSFYPNRGAALADLDGDGNLDVVILGRHSGSNDVHLLTFRPSNGNLIRSVAINVRGWFSCTPAVADYRGIGRNDVAFSTWDDRSIVMADGQTGQILWRFKTTAPNMQGVSAGDLDGDGQLDVAALSFDGHLYGLRGRDGQLLWKTPIPGGGWSKPVITRLGHGQSARVLVASAAGRLHVIDAGTGEELWTSNIAGGGKVVGHPAVVESKGRTIILAPLGAAGVVAFDWGRRTELWRSPKGFPVIASPVIMDRGDVKTALVVVASTTGDVWVLNLTDGKPIWRETVVEGNIEADPIVYDLDGDAVVDILIAGYDSNLHALNGAGSLGALE